MKTLLLNELNGLHNMLFVYICHVGFKLTYVVEYLGFDRT